MSTRKTLYQMNYFENGKISFRLWFLGLQPVGEWLLFSYTYHCCDRASPQVYSLETFQDVMESVSAGTSKRPAGDIASAVRKQGTHRK